MRPSRAGVEAWDFGRPVEQAPVRRREARIVHLGGRGDEPVGRVAVEIDERNGADADASVHRKLSQPGGQQVAAPLIHGEPEHEPLPLDQHRHLPEGNRGYGQGLVRKGVVRARAAVGSEVGQALIEPDEHVRVEHDHSSASQGSSRGETMSPRTWMAPACSPATVRRFSP